MTDSQATIVRVALETMQREIDELKRMLDERGDAKPTSLQGLWKGADITDEDIEEAKRSWNDESE